LDTSGDSSGGGGSTVSGDTVGEDGGDGGSIPLDLLKCTRAMFALRVCLCSPEMSALAAKAAVSLEGKPGGPGRTGAAVSFKPRPRMP
jgi:hypothetical protein